MKIYYGEWKRQQDMLDYFSIESLPPETIILAAEALDNGRCYIIGLFQGELFTDVSFKWVSRRCFEPERLESYTIWPDSSPHFKNLVNQIKERHR